MMITTQLKHLLVLLREKGELDLERLSRLLGYTPMKAEIASPEAEALVALGLKLKILKKSQKYYIASFNLENNHMGQFTANEILDLKSKIFGNKLLINEISHASYDRIKFRYNSNDFFHRLLFELSLLYKEKDNYLISDDLLGVLNITKNGKYVENSDAEELGNFAEKLIFKLEYYRLSKMPNALKHLDHVSLKNDFAGYDIRSFNVKNKKDIYIEVKGTSSSTTEFFLTANELETAKKFRKQYKIVVVRGIKIDDGKYTDIVEIKDPAKQLYKNYKMKPVVFRVSGKD